MESTFERYEIKYPIQSRMIPGIRQMLTAHGMQHDEYATRLPSDSYVVNSLYFESPELTSYYDKSGGFMDRDKIRVRIYNDRLKEGDDAIFLEQKIKHNMNARKIRTRISPEDYSQLMAGEARQVTEKHKDNSTLQAILGSVRLTGAKPYMSVRYIREPLVSATSPLFRITFDTQLQSGKSSDLRKIVSMRGFAADEAVMELKYAAFLPPWFTKVLTSFNLSRDAFSKYAMGVEALHSFNPLPR